MRRPNTRTKYGKTAGPRTGCGQHVNQVLTGVPSPAPPGASPRTRQQRQRPP